MEENNELIKISNSKLNNKDLIIVSLLEYICNMHSKNEMFEIICDYLYKNNIIDNKNIFNESTINLRNVCIDLIKRLIDTEQFIDNNNINSRYYIDFTEIEEIGNGAFGSVYKVYNKLDNNIYAIKKNKIKLHKDINKYLNEVRYLSNLNHYNIVRYHTTWIEFIPQILNKDIDNSDDSNSTDTMSIESTQLLPYLFIQMELCDSSLDIYLMNRKYDIIINYCIFSQILQGLKYIHHNNIIHNDLTPKNIFLKYEDNIIIKIGDFGLSKKYDENMIISEDNYGNILYMAPEYKNNKIITSKLDIYSLAIIYIELIHNFTTHMERIKTIENYKNGFILNDHIDIKYKEFIFKLLNPNYNERPDINETIKLFNDL